MGKKIYVKPVDEDYCEDMFLARMGEDVYPLFKAEVLDTHWIDRKWFNLLVAKASYDWGKGMVGNKAFADALFEYISSSLHSCITNIVDFVDNFGQEIEWGRSAADILRILDAGDKIPNDEHQAYQALKERRPVFKASNGVILYFHRPLSATAKYA